MGNTRVFGKSGATIYMEKKTGTSYTSPRTSNLAKADIEEDEGLDSMAKMNTDTEKGNTPFKRRIVWRNVTVYVVGHLAGLYGLYRLFFHNSFGVFIAVNVFGYFISIVGVQMGAHRYYSHRCFKASRAMQVAMLLAHTMTSQNCMWVWVRDHRQHHKYSDTDADPHNARNGFFFSHVGWLLSKKHPEVFEKGKKVDTSDLDADPLVQFQKRHYNTLWVLFAVLLPLVTAAYIWRSWWDAFFIFVVVRIVITLNITWLVNSWAHIYGMRPYDNGIAPAEVSWIGLFIAGEGYHNYHHTFPWDYKASELGMPYNLGTYAVKMFARLGMVWDLREASDEMILARAKKTGDGTPTLVKPKVQDLYVTGRNS